MATILRGSDNLDSSKVLSEELAGSIVTDASGRVTMPYQPAFEVSGTANEYTALITANGIANTIPYSVKVSGRNDEGFNYSTGTYTAPVDGVYEFHMHYLYQTANSGECRFYVNGIMRDRFYCYSERTGSGSAIYEMSAGDYIQVFSDLNVWLGPNGGYGSWTINKIA